MNNDTIKAAEEYVGAKTATSDQVIKRQSEIIKQKDEQIKELVEALTELISDINPCSHPAKDWLNSDFSNGYIGSRSMPRDKSIINAIKAIQKHRP